MKFKCEGDFSYYFIWGGATPTDAQGLLLAQELFLTTFGGSYKMSGMNLHWQCTWQIS